MSAARPQPAWLTTTLGFKLSTPQWESALALHMGCDVFLHMPCGGGKSAVFATAVLRLARIRPTVALLVVPLLSIRSMMVEFMERLTLESVVLDDSA